MTIFVYSSLMCSTVYLQKLILITWSSTFLNFFSIAILIIHTCKPKRYKEQVLLHIFRTWEKGKSKLKQYEIEVK